MAETRAVPLYPLGHTIGEFDRLAHQARLLERATERALRDAGIQSGQRVLDIGCGPGDVAMLLAAIVGEKGAVTGVERNAEAIARARERVRDAHLSNVEFIQGDVADFSVDEPFDAAVGRYILMFVADAAAVLSHVGECVHPGSPIVFMETSWNVFFALSPEVPLWRACQSLLHRILVRSGGDPEMGLHLCGLFQSAGLPAPQMNVTAVMATSDAARWMSDTLRSNLPQAQTLGISFAPLGDFETIYERLDAELRDAGVPAPIVPLVAAWSKKPAIP